MPERASEVYKVLAHIVEKLDIKKRFNANIDLRPSPASEGGGTQIQLPYFGREAIPGASSPRAMKVDGRYLTREEFTDWCNTHAIIDFPTFKKQVIAQLGQIANKHTIINNVACYEDKAKEGPPCYETLLVDEEPGESHEGHRDDLLCHLAARLHMMFPENWKDMLHDANLKWSDPLPSKDVDRIVRQQEFLTGALEELAQRVHAAARLFGTGFQQVEELVVFAEEFLELPAEVLITAMREHQKYFAVSDASGRLLPHFIAVNNTPIQEMAVVVRGHERVLRARLEDAKFFYRSDKAIPLDRQVEKLKSVLFQAQLGSLHDKVCRVQALAGCVAGLAGGGDDLRRQVERAAWLCKADLVSQMVGEFPKLQGLMGRVYATAQGEPPAVAAAIEEHYRPTASGAALPETPTGAVLAIADKLDTICGCFRAGLIPTGAPDPYALRRQGIGIVQIMPQRDLRFP